MSTVTALEKIKEFLVERVTPSIKLQKADDKDVSRYALVNPSAHVGWIPPKGYLPEGMESAIPCLIVSMDDASDDGQQGADLNIRISAAVFSPGLNDGQAFSPDFDGYLDLLNLIDRTRAELTKAQVIKNAMTIQSPIKWGMYAEQPYPYWYGWVTFSVTQKSYPRTEIEKQLLER